MDRSTGYLSATSTLTKPRPTIWYYGFVVLIVTFLLHYPWIVWGLVPGSDSNVHYQYFHWFKGQVQGGEHYPRWLTSMNGGAGSPIFFVQYPFPYFAAAALHYLLDLPETLSGESHALGLVFFFAAMFLSASLYLWCSRLVDQPSAAASAIVGLTLPYLWFDFYTRIAIGEVIALACIPLVLYFCHDLNDKPRRAVAGLALCFGLIFTSHILTVVLFLPFLGVYVFAISRKRQSLVSLTRTAIGTALGAGIAAIYLFPILIHRQYFDLNGLLSQVSGNYLYDDQLFPLDSVVLGSNLYDHRLSSWGWWLLGWLTRVGALLLVGLAVLRWRENSLVRGAHRVLAVLALLLVGLQVAAPLFGAHAFFAHAEHAADWVVVARSQRFGFAFLTLEIALISFLALPKQAYQLLPLCLLGGAVACYLLMTRWTAFLWEDMHFLWDLQFPWRFSGLLSIFTTGLIAFLFQGMLQNGGWRSRKLLVASSGFAAIALLGAVGSHAPRAFLHDSDFTPHGSRDMVLNTYSHASELFSDEEEFPVGTPVPATRILQGAGVVSLQTFSARQRLLKVDCSAPCTAQVAILYYPAWEAHDPSGARVALKFSSENGLMQLTLPTGSHQIWLELPRSTPEILGPWVSLLSLAVVLIVAFGDLRGVGRKAHVAV